MSKHIPTQLGSIAGLAPEYVRALEQLRIQLDISESALLTVVLSQPGEADVATKARRYLAENYKMTGDELSEAGAAYDESALARALRAVRNMKSE